MTYEMRNPLFAKRPRRGLGILNLKILNICLLSKWLYKLINEDGIWHELLRKKYLRLLVKFNGSRETHIFGQAL
jgi:hypothetical protein